MARQIPPDPAILVVEIVKYLEVALEQFREIVAALGGVLSYHVSGKPTGPASAHRYCPGMEGSGESTIGGKNIF